MSLNPLNAPRKVPRKDCKYNAAEQEQILPFKSDFIEARKPAERLLILKNQILPAMFNYWHTIGRCAQDRDESQRWAKELTQWLSNNWRMKHGRTDKAKTRRLCRQSFIWHHRKPAVLREIAKILRVEKVTTQTKGWFKYRTPATSQVLKDMTEEEKDQLDAEMEELGRAGIPDDVRRVSAQRHHVKRVNAAMTNQYDEMGATSIVFLCYTHPNGRTVVDVFDRIAELMDVPSATFIDTHRPEIETIQHLLLKYIATLKTRKEMGEVPYGIGNSKQLPGNVFGDRLNGFPTIPNPIPSKSWLKKDWEQLFTIYMSYQYTLACGGQVKQVPYKEIEARQSLFIDLRYLPPGMKFRPPRALPGDQIRDFFQFLFQRQEKCGTEDTFRFKSVKIDGKTMDAKYGKHVQEKPIRRRERPAKKVKPITPSIIAVTMDPPMSSGDSGSLNGARQAISAGLGDAQHTDQADGRSEIAATAGMAFIDEDHMRYLHSVGYPITIPVNGPADGPPQYIINTPATAAQLPRVEPAQEITHNPNIDPRLLALSPLVINAGAGVNIQLPSPRFSPIPLDMPSLPAMQDPIPLGMPSPPATEDPIPLEMPSPPATQDPIPLEMPSPLATQDPNHVSPLASQAADAKRGKGKRGGARGRVQAMRKSQRHRGHG